MTLRKATGQPVTLILILCLSLTITLLAYDRVVEIEANGEATAFANGLSRGYAVEIATRFINKSGAPWGKPNRVEWQNEYHRYLLIFETPDSERLILGHRAVHVDADGKPWFTPRG